MTPEQAAQLREPFPRESIGSLPRGGARLDYVGHAVVTDRLLAVDPEWNWEPTGWVNDTPRWDADGNNAIMWIRLTVCGVTRLGVGICKSDAFELEKQLISDALRNAAMRFGVALDLWSKEELPSGAESRPESGRAPRPAMVGRLRPPHRRPPHHYLRHRGPVPIRPCREDSRPSPPISRNRRERLKERAATLVAHKISVADARSERGLPTVDKADADDLTRWETMLDELERLLPAVRA